MDTIQKVGIVSPATSNEIDDFIQLVEKLINIKEVWFYDAKLNDEQFLKISEMWRNHTNMNVYYIDASNVTTKCLLQDHRTNQVSNTETHCDFMFSFNGRHELANHLGKYGYHRTLRMRARARIVAYEIFPQLYLKNFL